LATQQASNNQFLGSYVQADFIYCMTTSHALLEKRKSIAHWHRFPGEWITSSSLAKVSCPEAKVALECGTILLKIDGSNGMIITGDDGTFHPYERLDTKGKEIPSRCTALPEGSNPDAYKGHSYCHEPISLEVEGKKLKNRNQAMLDVVERHEDRLLSFGNTISIAWYGKKFQKTPGVPHDVAIAVHADQVCEEDFDLTQDGVRDFLLNSDPPIEGVIVEHKGKYWKVRSDW
jgi:hypothetical protein